MGRLDTMALGKKTAREPRGKKIAAHLLQLLNFGT